MEYPCSDNQGLIKVHQRIQCFVFNLVEVEYLLINRKEPPIV